MTTQIIRQYKFSCDTKGCDKSILATKIDSMEKAELEIIQTYSWGLLRRGNGVPGVHTNYSYCPKCLDKFQLKDGW